MNSRITDFQAGFSGDEPKHLDFAVGSINALRTFTVTTKKVFPPALPRIDYEIFEKASRDSFFDAKMRAEIKRKQQIADAELKRRAQYNANMAIQTQALYSGPKPTVNWYSLNDLAPYEHADASIPPEPQPISVTATLTGHWSHNWTPGENVARCMHYSTSHDVNVITTSIARVLGIDPDDDFFFRTLEFHLKRSTYISPSVRLSEISPERVTPGSDPVLARSTYSVTEDGRLNWQYLDPCDGSDLTKCSCGFYGTFDTHIGETVWQYDNVVSAVVQHYGQTLIGEKGLRSTKVRILAVAATYEDLSMRRRVPDDPYQKWLDRYGYRPTSQRGLPDAQNVVRGIATSYPEARLFEGPYAHEEMVREYPIGDTDPSDPISPF